MLVFIALFSSYFLSCKNVQNKPKAVNLSVKIDNSTPENLMRDIFRYSLMSDSLFSEDTSSIHYAIYSTSYKKIIKAEQLARNLVIIMDKGRNGVVIDAEIEKTERQNDTSLSVYTRELRNYDSKEYRSFIYNFVKEQNGWFIDDYIFICFECKGTGKIVGKTSKKHQMRICHACYGRGWFSFRNDKPKRRVL